jgi:hypothetical protein
MTDSRPIIEGTLKLRCPDHDLEAVVRAGEEDAYREKYYCPRRDCKYYAVPFTVHYRNKRLITPDTNESDVVIPATRAFDLRKGDWVYGGSGVFYDGEPVWVVRGADIYGMQMLELLARRTRDDEYVHPDVAEKVGRAMGRIEGYYREEKGVETRDYNPPLKPDGNWRYTL